MKPLTDQEIRRHLFILSDAVYRLENLLEDVANSFNLNSRDAGMSITCEECQTHNFGAGYVCGKGDECPHGLGLREE